MTSLASLRKRQPRASRTHEESKIGMAESELDQCMGLNWKVSFRLTQLSILEVHYCFGWGGEKETILVSFQNLEIMSLEVLLSLSRQLTCTGPWTRDQPGMVTAGG